MKKAVIVDEARFSRICSAILEGEGCGSNIVSRIRELPEALSHHEAGLVITSYPYGANILDAIKRSNIPAIILFDQIDEHIFEVLSGVNNTYCMVKPLNYQQFKDLVKRLLSGTAAHRGGFSIV